MPRRPLLQRIVRRIKTDLIPPRPITVTIADEPYILDSRTPLRGALHDYDFRWLSALSEGRKCILDVGTNFGLMALVFARHMDPDGTLVLFEPCHSPLTLTFRNLRRSELLGRRIRFFNAFAGAKHEQHAAYLSIPEQAGDFWKWVAGLPPTAPVVTLDGVVAQLNLKPDLIKIDVEGAELDVLANARMVARQHRPLYEVEVHAFTGSIVDAISWLLQWSSEMDYQAWFMPEHVKIIDPQELRHRGRCHVLLIPQEQDYPAFLPSIPEGPKA